MDTKPLKEERLFEIPATNWALFEERFAKILKRTQKLNCGEVGYEVVKETIKQAPSILVKGSYDQGSYDEIKEDKRMIKWRTIRVWGDSPKIAGWTFIAKLEHDEKIGTCVKTLPGYELPEKYRTADRFDCDHCHKHLWRRDTFVVKNEAGDHKQVGRQCLRDFLGHENPEHAAQYAEYFLTIFSMADDAGDYAFGGGHYAEEYYELRQVLAHTISSVEAYGWVSRKTADESCQRSTADRVGWYIGPDPTGHDSKLDYNEDQLAEADIIIEWALALPQEEVDKDDYLYNISLLAKSGMTTYRRFGFACSMIASYRFKVGKAADKSIKEASQHFGEVGKRLPIGEVVLVGEYGPFESEFGTSRLYKFKQGNFTFTWFTGTILNHEKVGRGGYTYNYKKVEVGETVMIKAATVKEHKEWKGWKETSINRPTFDGLKVKVPIETEQPNPL